MEITASVFMGSMVVFDCGQKRLRFVQFQDDPAKHDDGFANPATSMAAGIIVNPVDIDTTHQVESTSRSIPMRCFQPCCLVRIDGLLW